METGYQFKNVEEALGWSTEVLRARRFPRLSSIYGEMEQEEGGEKRTANLNLPSDYDERLSLAMKVYSFLSHNLDAEEQRLIQFTHWGDYADEKRLRTAEALQQRMRAEGKRIRLSYTYSHRQVGAALNMPCHKTVKRRLAKIYDKLNELLEEEGLIEQVYEKIA